jgi:hypothetical protein
MKVLEPAHRDRKNAPLSSSANSIDGAKSHIPSRCEGICDFAGHLHLTNYFEQRRVSGATFIANAAIIATAQSFLKKVIVRDRGAFAQDQAVLLAVDFNNFCLRDQTDQSLIALLGREHHIAQHILVHVAEL